MNKKNRYKKQVAKKLRKLVAKIVLKMKRLRNKKYLIRKIFKKIIKLS